MRYFAGLDVSLEETAICVVDETGRILDKMGSREKLVEKEVTCGASEPGALVTAFDPRARVFDGRVL